MAYISSVVVIGIGITYRSSVVVILAGEVGSRGLHSGHATGIRDE